MLPVLPPPSSLSTTHGVVQSFPPLPLPTLPLFPPNLNLLSSPPPPTLPSFNLPPHAQMSWIYDIVSDEKANLLKRVRDASLADKTSVQGKVFVSFLYFFGKHVATNCRTDDWRDYFSACFDLVWSLFPNWQKLDQNGILCTRGTTEKLSVKAFARVTAQSACRNSFKRLNKMNISTKNLAIEGVGIDS